MVFKIPHWFYPITFGLSLSLFLFTVARFFQGKYSPHFTKNKLTFVPLLCMAVYFGDLSVISVIGQTQFNKTEVGSILHRSMDTILTVSVITAITFFLFELHLVGKMISYQHSLDEDEVPVKRAEFQEQERRL